jgi:signal peptidase I
MREAALAVGLVVLILTSMWIATGTFPPMVVVESGSMMHDLDDGSIGSIDPGDLVLVMNPARVDIVTYAEATQKGNDDFGHESHGMPGDVIIYRKNGDSQTPVIHRALLMAVSNVSGGWDVPGTPLVGVQTITITLDYPCNFHGNLTIVDWEPPHEGYLTTGDNTITNGCKIDQLAATGQDSRNGLKDENGMPVTAVRDVWVVGVASAELPWIGAIKLLVSGTQESVTTSTWYNLTLTIALILASPLIFDSAVTWIRVSDEEE